MTRLRGLAVPLAATISVLGAQHGTAQTIKLNAAGATFPMPIYQKWFGEYHTAHSNIEINYGGGGSGAGIKQLTEGTVDFGASDMPMKDEQIAAMKIKAFHFPTVLGAVVLTYNIPGITATLKFSPQTIAGIFLGSINRWDDKAIAADNPGVKFPKDDIVPVHRSDASGTTFVFTDYLCKVSPEFKAKVGSDTKVSFPGEQLAGNQNAGVAGLVKQTPDSIGYIELTYAVQTKMAYGDIKNAAGSWVHPSLESVTAAAAAEAKKMQADFRTSITNASGKDSYPIATFTYLLIPGVIADARKKQVLTDVLKWILGPGQNEVAALSYAPLPKEVVAREVKQIAMIQ